MARLLLIRPGEEVPTLVGRAGPTGEFALEGLPRGAWLGARKGRRVSRMAWLEGPGADRPLTLTLRLGTSPLEQTKLCTFGLNELKNQNLCGAKLR